MAESHFKFLSNDKELTEQQHSKVQKIMLCETYIGQVLTLNNIERNLSLELFRSKLKKKAERCLEIHGITQPQINKLGLIAFPVITAINHFEQLYCNTNTCITVDENGMTSIYQDSIVGVMGIGVDNLIVNIGRKEPKLSFNSFCSFPSDQITHKELKEKKNTNLKYKA